MTITNMTLVKVAAVGGIATVLMGFTARAKIENNIKTASFYKEALEQVRGHPAAVQLLGKPIRDGYINVGRSSENLIEGNKGHFTVPLKGQKQKGTMYLYTTKEDNDVEWTLSRIELAVANLPDKKLIVKNDENKQTIKLEVAVTDSKSVKNGET
ncbi:uncharacterized protein LOC109536437 [Dendroctonus ponderosae]